MSAEENRRIGARLRDERRAAGMVVSDLARRFREIAPPHVTLPRQLKDIERAIRAHEAGEHAATERYRLLYAAALGKDESDLFGPELDAQPPLPPVEVSGSESPASSLVDITVPTHAKDDDVRRRAALELLAMLGVGAAALDSGPLRHLVDMALTSEPRDLADWHLACDDHLHALRSRAPAQARDDLVIDLLALAGQLKTAAPDALVELRRVEAALATLHANVLTRLGDHGAAIRWWRTARTAADATGDLELRLGVCATEAGHGLSGQRSPATVLKLTQRGRRISGDRPSLGLALVVCSEAKALSALGRHTDAVQTLNLCRDLFAAARQPHGIMSGYWQGGQLPFAENTIYAAAGDESGMTQARAQWRLLWNGDYQIPVELRLHEALCTVVNGGTDNGARQAAETLAALPPDQQSHMITETGRTVLRAVPLDQRDRPAVRELRALTAGGSAAALG